VTEGSAARVCHPWFYGDTKIDRRRAYKSHDPIPQPFYSQDFRLRCQRCGLLAPREAFGV